MEQEKAQRRAHEGGMVLEGSFDTVGLALESPEH